MKTNYGPNEFLIERTVSNLQILPPKAVRQVVDFVEFLQTKYQHVPTADSPKPLERKPQFGSAKGLIVMADDFDAPLADFEEYM
ncbi:MAG: DUF2281 domain-containing protein [Chloroflexota bacterium]|nr:DUF2281 domain-containing protein [Chloroflexota bacterium]